MKRHDFVSVGINHKLARDCAIGNHLSIEGVEMKHIPGRMNAALRDAPDLKEISRTADLLQAGPLGCTTRGPQTLLN
jgi:hypothetical protein